MRRMWSSYAGVHPTASSSTLAGNPARLLRAHHVAGAARQDFGDAGHHHCAAQLGKARAGLRGVAACTQEGYEHRFVGPVVHVRQIVERPAGLDGLDGRTDALAPAQQQLVAKAVLMVEPAVDHRVPPAGVDAAPSQTTWRSGAAQIQAQKWGASRTPTGWPRSTRARRRSSPRCAPVGGCARRETRPVPVHQAAPGQGKVFPARRAVRPRIFRQSTGADRASTTCAGPGSASTAACPAPVRWAGCIGAASGAATAGTMRPAHA